MKILTLVWSIGPGGTERAAVNYAIGYKKFGQQSKVLVLGEGFNRYEDLKKAGVETILLQKKIHETDAIIRDIKKWEPDIIHIHNFSQPLLSYINRLRGGATKIVETNVFSRPLYDSAYCNSIHLSLQLTVWGQWRFTRRMKSATISPPSAVLPYIVDAQNFSRPARDLLVAFRNKYQIPEDAFLAGRVGQAHPSKWHPSIVEVIRNTVAPSNNIYYLLAGAPKTIRTALQNQSSFIQSRVRVLDQLEGDSELSLIYYNLNCFVHHSKIGESFGYVLAEAMLCEVPVITVATPFNDNGQFEVAGNTATSKCVINTAQIIQQIKILYSMFNTGTTPKNTEGRQRVIQFFSFDAVTPAALQLYRELIAGKPIAAGSDWAAVNDFFTFYRPQKKLASAIIQVINTSFFFRTMQMLKRLKFL